MDSDNWRVKREQAKVGDVSGNDRPPARPQKSHGWGGVPSYTENNLSTEEAIIPPKADLMPLCRDLQGQLPKTPRQNRP